MSVSLVDTPLSPTAAFLLSAPFGLFINYFGWHVIWNERDLRESAVQILIAVVWPTASTGLPPFSPQFPSPRLPDVYDASHTGHLSICSNGLFTDIYWKSVSTSPSANIKVEDGSFSPATQLTGGAYSTD
jgi:hypothetical protein